MPLTARQLRQPLTIEAIGRVPYFADVLTLDLLAILLKFFITKNFLVSYRLVLVLL